MISSKKKICIAGTGGFAKETLLCLMDIVSSNNQKIEHLVCFMEEDDCFKDKIIMGVQVIPRSTFDPKLYEVVIAIGDPINRKKVAERLPSDTVFTTIIHPSAILSKWVKIGEGSIITAGVILTYNITLGKHTHLNLQSTIGHDCKIGDYFTTAPGVNISGDCVFGNGVYFGTNSCVRQGVSICDNVTIGMGGVVLNNISEPGVYVGNPVKKLK